MRIFTFFIAAFVAVSTCFAQDGSSGVIRGVVLDPVNRRVPGATIALVNNGTGFRYQQMSDIEGRFAFQLLPPGEHSARVTSDGMSPQLNDHVEVNLGGATEIEFRLTVAGTRESVTVSAEAKVVETEPRHFRGHRRARHRESAAQWPALH